MTEPAAPRRVLVAGGAGVFGARLVQGLIATTALDVVVAGRHERRLAALITDLAAPGRLTALVMDATRASVSDLAGTGAFAVVDAAGPFQGGNTHLARTAIAAGMHYVDLAGRARLRGRVRRAGLGGQDSRCHRADLRALANNAFPAGAGACAGKPSLAAIEAEFAPYRITSSLTRGLAPPCLYRRVLGGAFDSLPEPVRRMHEPGWRLRARGRARVDGPAGPAAATLAVLFRFPRAGDDVPLALDVAPDNGRETWTRTFGDRAFTSVLSASATPGRIVERFGFFAFELDAPAGPAGVLGMPVRAWRVGRLPLPRFLAPISAAREDVDEQGRFRFDVELRLPLGLGRLVRYRGWLARR